MAATGSPRSGIGALVGGIAGAGIAIGLFFQPTTANIHSGYSFAGVLEWVVLGFVGGWLGLLAGFLVGRRLPSWRPAFAVLLVLAVLGTTGWIVSGTRTTIDCDSHQDFCEQRYG